MHSGVFGITTSAAAKMLHEFVNQHLTVGDAEIMDLDEERYRKGEWNIRLFGIATGIVEPTYVQVGKTLYESVSDDEIKDELVDHILDEMDQHPDTLFYWAQWIRIYWMGNFSTSTMDEASTKNNTPFCKK